jgi:hypothetical protein
MSNTHNLQTVHSPPSVVSHFGAQRLMTITEALYPAECLETTTRAKGMSMKIFVINIANFFNLFFIP